jgi:hypothetical protein
MNKAIYGLQSFSDNAIILTPEQIPTCKNASGQTLTPQLLNMYIARINSLLQTLARTRQPVEITLNLMDVTRQELCALTKTTFRVLPPPPEVGINYTTNGKYQIETNMS